MLLYIYMDYITIEKHTEVSVLHVHVYIYIYTHCDYGSEKS